MTADKELIAKVNKPMKINATTMGSTINGDPIVRFSPLSCPSFAEASMSNDRDSASKQALKKTIVSAEDIDVLELAGNGSWHSPVYMETCGFCKFCLTRYLLLYCL